jgi:hypothetical protein
MDKLVLQRLASTEQPELHILYQLDLINRSCSLARDGFLAWTSLCKKCQKEGVIEDLGTRGRLHYGIEPGSIIASQLIENFAKNS